MARPMKEQLEEWERRGEFEKMVQAIETVPQGKRPLGMTVMLARCCFQLSQKTGRRDLMDRAESILDSVQERGRSNPQWMVLKGHILDRRGRLMQAGQYELQAQDMAWEQIGGPSRDPYTAREETVMEDYIRRNFDVEDRVLDWRCMCGLPMKIFVSPARNGRRYQTLISCGIGACPQPKIIQEGTTRIEVMMRIPADWKLDPTSLQMNRWNWPLQALSREYDGLILLKQAIHPGIVLTFEKQLASGVRFNSIVTMPPLDLPSGSEECLLPSGEAVLFLQVLCLYPSETDASDRIPTPEFTLRMLSSEDATIADPKRRPVFR